MPHVILLVSLGTSAALAVMNVRLLRLNRQALAAVREWHLAAEAWESCARRWQSIAQPTPGTIIDITPQESGHSIH